MAMLYQDLGTLIAKLNSVRNNSTDANEQEQLQRVIRVLMAVFQELVTEDLDENSAAYKDALTAVRKAQTTADDGVKKLQKVSAVIDDATKAAKIVDKVIGLFGKILA